MSASATLSSPGPRALFPLRKRTGTAAFHLSKEAVDFGSENISAMSAREAVKFFAEVRWGSSTEMPCPHCSTVAQHYWTVSQLRWKCTCCGKRFSVTSGTVFSGRKLPLTKLLGIIFSWANGSSGKPALQLRRDWNVAYATVFTLIHKVREGLLRGFNTGVLCGVHEMDGMDVNGRRYREKRNKPQTYKPTGKPKIPEALLKPKEVAPEFVGPPVPPKHDKKVKQHPDRRLLLVLRQRGVSKGKGSCATRISVALTESSSTVTQMATRFASAESKFQTDEDPSYAPFKRLFAEHKTVCHSETFSTKDGTNNNQAESFNWRVRRAIEGIYLSASNKYLKDYAAEQAWREDTRRMSTGQKLKHLLRVAMGVGVSLWWRGYTHGKHRLQELLIEGAQDAPGRGRKKGAEGRPPK